ncbi:LysR substrate-binding domain-containing protein [Sphingomonas arantia]|uniref:LysR substrate-binding domain-containing protein n=1 Tax=Sphingomonas arantia TaxID=1460676 RepID=A0ABW4TXU9_9SPHN
MMDALDQLNLRHLRAVVAVAARGTVTAAAADVALSQPALTQGLAKLETMLGRPLFDRHADGMRTTEAGAIMVARTAAAAKLLADTIRAIRGRGMAQGFARADLLLTMTQLRALAALAREGSYVAAARATGVTQPAVHRAVRDIERLCGVPLVERRGRGVMLTAAGVRLGRAARLALAEIGAALDEVAALSGRDHGRIAIGAMPLARAWLLPTAIGRFHRDEPHMVFDIAEGAYSELVEPLRDGEFDLLLGALRDPPPAPDLIQEPFFVDRIAVVARAAHPLMQDGVRPDLATLAGHSWLAPRRGTPLRHLWERLFGEAGLPLPAVWIECGSVMMLRTLMMSGDYLTLLSAEQVAFELDAGVLRHIALTPPSMRRTIGVTMRAGWRPTGAQARFLDLLRHVGTTRTSA